MPLDRTSLLDACYDVARQIMGDVDADQTTILARQLADIAADHEQFVISRERDPALITRAVLYLASVHAIPPMHGDTRWFADMLTALIELACPNSIVGPDQDPFFRDIEAGIATARSRYEH